MNARERATALGRAITRVLQDSAAAVVQAGAVQADGGHVTAHGEIVERRDDRLVVEVFTQATGRRERFDVRIEAHVSPHIPPGWNWYRHGPGRPEFVVGDRVLVSLDPIDDDMFAGTVRAVLGTADDPRPGYRVKLDSDDRDTEHTVAPQAVHQLRTDGSS